MVSTITIEDGDKKASWRTCQSFNDLAELVSNAIGAYRHDDGSPRTAEDLYADVSALGLGALGDFTDESVFRPKAQFTSYTLSLIVKRLDGMDITKKLFPKTDTATATKTWLYNLPSRMTDEQRRLVSAVVLSCWEREDLYFWVDKDGISRYLLGCEPDYCPLYYPARKLWHIVKGDQDETHMAQVGDRVYVEAEGRKESFKSWQEACEYVFALCNDKKF